MTDKIFSMPVRVNDFMASTVNLSNEKLGMYFRLICFAWEDKAQLTQNIDEIYEICKAYDEETKKKVDNLITKYFEFNEIAKCFEQNGQKKEWARVNKVSNVNSENGKLGGRPKANGNRIETETKALILKPILNKNKYIDEFNNFWGECVYKVSKGQAEKNWLKLPEEIKKKPNELVKKYNSYVSDCKIKGSFIKHPSTWLSAESYLDEGLQENIVFNNEPNENLIKSKVGMWKKGMMKHMAKTEEIQFALKNELITSEFAKELG
jgi:uncharacterized protein YdaU (DUF1376 family)